MPLTNKRRRELLAQSHRLSPAATINPGELSEAIIAHVRASFATHPLVKIRVSSDKTTEADAVAAELVHRVPCELVRRIGHVVLLYRPAANEKD